MVDIRQTQQYANYLSRIGWTVERIAETNYFIKKFPIIGSVIKIQRPEQLNNETMKQLRNRYRAFQAIVEPKADLDAKYLTSLGYKLSKSPYLPTKTLQLDLTLPINRLISSTKKDAKSALRTTRNLQLTTANNINEFRNSWKKAVSWKRHVPPLSHLIALKKSFKNNCIVYQCTSTAVQNKNAVLAGAIFLMTNGMGYYWQAFTSAEGRRLKAQYKIVWEGIKWAKRCGAKVFDFEGIYDERFPNKSWLGFTHFKKSFGGHEVEYPGCYIKNRLPL